MSATNADSLQNSLQDSLQNRTAWRRRGKAIINTFLISVCVCVFVSVRAWVNACVRACVDARAKACACARVALLIQHATCMHHIVHVLWPPERGRKESNLCPCSGLNSGHSPGRQVTTEISDSCGK